MVNRTYWTLDVLLTEVTTTAGRRTSTMDRGHSFKMTSTVDRWTYLKEARREPRTNKALGYQYIFSEGPWHFQTPDVVREDNHHGEGGGSRHQAKQQ